MAMNRRTIAAAGVAAVLAAGAIGAAAASGGSRESDDADQPATGPAAEHAAAVALTRFPGGRVTAIERDADSGAAWEVEVTRPDGAQVDVDVDDGFRIVEIDDPE
jgi:uncharacterized membrane protein YkoI